jgi:DNA polymerase elongation subunit (family B)
MERLVFDIETVGASWESLEQSVQESLLRSARNEEEQEEVRTSLSLFPVTAQIVCIALYSPGQDHAVVYFQAPQGGVERTREEKEAFIPCTEKELLVRFWEATGKARQIVTFNGRGFDCPMILVRSAAHRVQPTTDLMPNRYSPQHIDLMDQFTFYGAMRRRFSLDLWCDALGIEQPKREVRGSDVAGLFAAGDYMKIARYCLGDAKATSQLFDLWSKYMRLPAPEQ